MARGEPRIRFRCSLGSTLKCRTKSQSIACAKEWRMLLPLGLADNELSYQLKRIRNNKEGTFFAWRSRYNTAGNDFGSRTRVRRRSFMELRAAFGLLLEWFRICARHGWLTVPDFHGVRPVTPKPRTGGRSWLNRVEEARARWAVAVPRGRYAADAELGGGITLRLPAHDPPWPHDEADRPPPDDRS